MKSLAEPFFQCIFTNKRQELQPIQIRGRTVLTSQERENAHLHFFAKRSVVMDHFQALKLVRSVSAKAVKVQGRLSFDSLTSL